MAGWYLRRWSTAAWILFLVAFVSFLAAADSEDDFVLRWASSGGGFRSMIGNFGFANIFVQAGLVNPVEQTCNFTAMSANSGGTWFLTQFAYSQPFFERIALADHTAIREFAMETLSAQSGFFTKGRDFTWAGSIEGQFRAAATDYGDPGLPDRQVTWDNRVLALSNTDIFLQTSLAANSRYEAPSFFRPFGDDISYVGPSGDANEVLTVPLGAHWAVKASRSFFQWSMEPSSLPLTTRSARGPRTFKLNDWDTFHLFPPGDGSQIYVPAGNSATDPVPLSEPFGGKPPTMTQIAAASSAAVADRSGRVPSFFAQRQSVVEFDEEDGGFLAKAVRLIIALLNFNFPITDGLAVCTQWPNNCGATDGRFMDGGFSDGPTLALNIGQYHTVDNGNLTKTMKVILTNNNFVRDSNVKFLSYFSSTFNEGVAPGDFVWAPFTAPDDLSAQKAPWRSPQIFAEYLDDATLTSQFEPVSSDSSITTAVYTATTIENAAFGVLAGQKVEILLLQTNSNIPLGGKDFDALADLACDIAGSEPLVERIRSFIAL